MYTHATVFRGQYRWVIGPALLPLLMPCAVVILGIEPTVSSTPPAPVSYYSQAITACVLGIACGVSSLNP